MRIDLRAKRLQLRFRRQLADFLFADFAIESLAGDSNRVDTSRDGNGDGLERRDIVGQKSPAAREVIDVDAERWRFTRFDKRVARRLPRR